MLCHCVCQHKLCLSRWFLGALVTLFHLFWASQLVTSIIHDPLLVIFCVLSSLALALSLLSLSLSLSLSLNFFFWFKTSDSPLIIFSFLTNTLYKSSHLVINFNMFLYSKCITKFLNSPVTCLVIQIQYIYFWVLYRWTWNGAKEDILQMGEFTFVPSWVSCTRSVRGFARWQTTHQTAGSVVWRETGECIKCCLAD